MVKKIFLKNIILLFDMMKLKKKTFFNNILKINSFKIQTGFKYIFFILYINFINTIKSIKGNKNLEKN